MVVGGLDRQSSPVQCRAGVVFRAGQGQLNCVSCKVADDYTIGRDQARLAKTKDHNQYDKRE